MNTLPDPAAPPAAGCFAASYAGARNAWLQAATACGARLDGLRHPGTGPDGEALWLDAACFGDPAADRVFVVACGTHGIEGFAGSAVQVAWLRSGGPGALPPGTGVVLLHAINPWGFAHGQRVTENNVDLNRNFIDFTPAPLPNVGYAELHSHLMLDHWDEAAIARAFAALDAYRERHGEQAYSDAFNGGQYHHADGLFYGGRQPEWSNLALRTMLPRLLGAARQCVWADLHTGIGPYGRPFLINLDPAGSRARRRALSVWGKDALDGGGSTHKALAVYRGLMLDAVATMLPACAVSAVAIEFGTRERRLMQRAHLALAWLRRQSGEPVDAVQRARIEYREAFNPSDPAWQQSVLHEGVQLCRRGRDALLADPE